MKELISIEKQKIGNDTVNAVNARDLHSFLNIKSDFRNWIKNRIKDYDFIENQDFISNGKNLPNGGRSVEYYISIDMAKELSMVERNEKGKEARKYFIECERNLKEKEPFKIPQTYPEALRLAADQQELIEIQEKKIKEAKPKVEYVNRVLNSPSLVTTTQIAKDYRLSALSFL